MQVFLLKNINCQRRNLKSGKSNVGSKIEHLYYGLWYILGHGFGKKWRGRDINHEFEKCIDHC